MKRDLVRLTQTHYDLLIVGGGLYGLFIAWEAALRGLQVGLVEKGDFGHATSSNSLRVIHGGLRYLQHGALTRMRQSIRERSVFLRIAPHLIHPLPFLFPTYGHGLRGKEIFSLALFIHDLIGFDRNQGLNHHTSLPSSQLISKEEFCRLVPGIHDVGLTGAAVCYDAQMLNPERLLISLAQSADQAGAHLANYVKVTGFLGLREDVQGVLAHDVLSDEKLEIQADLVINASGPWANSVLNLTQDPKVPPVTSFGRAFNILIKRQLVPNYALGVYSRHEYKDDQAIIQKGSRLYIITPCHHGSLIGTAHLPLGPERPQDGVTEEEILDFVDELNEGFPEGAITPGDISWVYWGVQPTPSRDGEMAQFSKRYEIKDHEFEHGIKGLISVIGVKFTEARHVAEKIVNLVFKKLRKPPSPSLTASTPVYGGRIADIEGFVNEEVRKQSGRIGEEIIRSLITKYGTAYSRVLFYLDEVGRAQPSLSTTLAVSLAEVKYGVREEGAQKLVDAIFRRMTIDVTQSPPEKSFLELCAMWMSKEMGWDVNKERNELREVEEILQSRISRLL
jgi:glycerol-3-phosphate dehydrogenase